MNITVFAYGTLQIPEVMVAVTGRTFPAESATLHGFARYRIRGTSYPGVRPRAGASVSGVLYCGLDCDALRRLDGFEDDYYCRQVLTVITSRNAAVQAQVYVVEQQYYASLVDDTPWDLDEFRQRSLVQLLNSCRIFDARKFPATFSVNSC